MESLQAAVMKFRKATGLPNAHEPRALTTEEAYLHIQLIRDEFEKELVPALMAGDTVEIYDAGIDVIYYLIGMLCNAGMDLEPGFFEVHDSNMSKFDPVTGEAIRATADDPSGEPEGKILKGPNYFAPDLARVLFEGPSTTQRMDV